LIILLTEKKEAIVFLGEYDLDTLFFSNNNQLLPGSEAALILYSAYVFTMFIVMMNIMVSLVKCIFVCLFMRVIRICLGWSCSR
jgi:hypothetical protein